MKNYVLVLMCALGMISLNAQNTGELGVLLDRLDSYSDSPLSIDMVISSKFNAEEQTILFNHLTTQAENAATTVSFGANRNPSVYSVLNVRGDDVFGTMAGDPPFSIDPIVDPFSITCFADDFDAAGVLYAMEFLNDVNDDPLSRNIVTIDPTDGTVAVIGDALGILNGETPTGMAFDFTSNTMYVSSATRLFTLDTGTGALTEVGSFGVAGSMIWLVIDNDGNAWGANITDDLFYSIDLLSGGAIDVGPLGIDIGFAQEATIDPETNILYMAAYTGGGTGGVHTVDMTTGAATLVGDTGPLDAEFGMFSVAGVPATAGVDENQISQVAIFPNPTSEIVNIKTPGSIEVQNAVLYDVLGKDTGARLVNGSMSVSHLPRGVYLLNLETSAGTITEKIVKQ